MQNYSVMKEGLHVLFSGLSWTVEGETYIVIHSVMDGLPFIFRGADIALICFTNETAA